LAIYKLLPQTNCKQCGEPTCWIFASKLSVSQKTWGDCSPLGLPENAGKLADLKKMIIDAPAIT